MKDLFHHTRWSGWGSRAPASSSSWRRWASVLPRRANGGVWMMELFSGRCARYSLHRFLRWARAWGAAARGWSGARAPPTGHRCIDIWGSSRSCMQCGKRSHWTAVIQEPSSTTRHWPADWWSSVSVSGTGGTTSGRTPSARRHSPPGTLPSTRGVWSDGVERVDWQSSRTWSYTKQLKPRTGGHCYKVTI